MALDGNGDVGLVLELLDDNLRPGLRRSFVPGLLAAALAFEVLDSTLQLRVLVQSALA